MIALTYADQDLASLDEQPQVLGTDAQFFREYVAVIRGFRQVVPVEVVVARPN